MLRTLWLCVWMIFASAFFADAEAQAKLPKDLPPKAEITYISAGGFLPSHFKIFITGDTMKITDQSARTNGKELVWNAKLTEDELNTLYRAFVENGFDSIEPNKEIQIPDGKFRSMELKFDRQRFYATMGDGIKSAKSHAERFNNIENAFGILVKKYRK